MPTPRRPLGVINTNIGKRKELTLYQRGFIIGLLIAGKGATEIAEAINTPRSTVYTTISQS